MEQARRMHCAQIKSEGLPVVRDDEFERIRQLIFMKAGIFLKDHKKTLVANRLRRRLEVLGIHDYGTYCDYLTRNPGGRYELGEFIDCLTTNETFFFRYPEQLDFLAQTIQSEFKSRNATGGKIRIWSAGCSSGEEPCSIAIAMNEKLDPKTAERLEIVASDISQRMIGKAQEGVYLSYALQRLPEAIRRKYFVMDPAGDRYVISDAIKGRIRFIRNNLMEPFCRGQFDIILCCNVLIYFNKESKGKAVWNILQSLKPKGYFMVGFSESLMDSRSGLSYVRPSVYRKTEL